MKAFCGKEEGATAPEYALMVGLILTLIVGAVTLVGNALVPIFTNAAGMFGAAS